MAHKGSAVWSIAPNSMVFDAIQLMADRNVGALPVVEKGELVGIVFDGNIDSIASTYLYSDDSARAVHVASQGIVDALRKLYKATRVLKELGVPET